jgi:hypothetical protein
VLASAVVTLVAFAVMVVLASAGGPAAAQSTDPWDGSGFTTPASYGTSVNGRFEGVFKHTPAAPIGSVDLDLQFSATDRPSPGCEPAPARQTQQYETTTTSTSVETSTSGTPPTDPVPTSTPGSSSVTFGFTVTFTCNGVYDVTATGNIEDPSGATAAPLHKSVSIVAVRVAVPPPPPASSSFVATSNANRTVTLSWAAPAAYATHAPPDFEGYRLSREDAGGSSFAVIGATGPNELTFTDSSIPASGGSYVYSVESVRKFATSPAVVTASPLAVGGAGGGTSGGSVGGGSGGGRVTATTADPGSGGTGKVQFDSNTLPGDNAEPGSNDALSAIPGGGAVQRFAAGAGAGLLKPFATALDLGVWAALLLFLTRRAAKAERALLSTVEVE